MKKNPYQSREIFFYPAYVSVVTAIGYPMYEKRFAISEAVLPRKAQKILNNNGNSVIISPYVGLNGALNAHDKLEISPYTELDKVLNEHDEKDDESQRLVRLTAGDTPDALLAYEAIDLRETHEPVEHFDGYGMQNLPATIELPISDTRTLKFIYSKVKFSCVVGEKVVTSDHVLYTNDTLRFDSHEESPAFLREVEEFNQAIGPVIVQKIPISHNGFVWGGDFPADPSDTSFTLALTDQPTLLLPPSPEGAERIGEYLCSSGIISR